MGLNKSKKIAKKSVKPAEPVLEEEIEELDEVEEEVVEEPAPAKRARKSKKEVAPAPVAEAEAASDTDIEVSFDTDAIVNGICDDKRNLTSAVYQVQLRLPADIEPMYKSIPPRLKRALRDAFAELVRKAYAQTH